MTSKAPLLLFAVFCAPPMASATTLELSPDRTLTSAWSQIWENQDVFCPVRVDGLAPDFPAPPEIRVGFRLDFDPGADPFPCGWRRYYIYHGFLSFPVHQIPFSNSVWIRKATLRLRWLDSENNFPIGVPNGLLSCATALFEAPAVWPQSQTPAPFSRSGLTNLTELPLFPNQPRGRASFAADRRLEIDVTETVRRWYRNGGNTGFLLANNLPVFGGESAHSLRCHSRYGEPRLVVEYSQVHLEPPPVVFP